MNYSNLIELKTLKGPSNARILSVAISPDGSKIISGSDDNISVWNANTYQLIKTLKGHTGSVRSVAINPDGTKIVSGSSDKTIKVWWDVNAVQEIKTLALPGQVKAVAFSPDGKKIFSAFSNGIKSWDVNTFQVIETLSTFENPKTLAISPDGSTIIMGTFEDYLIVLDANTFQTIIRLNMNVESVAFSPDGSKFVTGTENNISLWDANTFQNIRSISDSNLLVKSLAFSPDGSKFISGSEDKTIKVWDTITFEEITTLNGHNFSVTSVVLMALKSLVDHPIQQLKFGETKMRAKTNKKIQSKPCRPKLF